MSTKLIGYDVSKGTFKSDRGEEIPYNKRVLYMMTDEGTKDTYTGYIPVDKQSIKLEVLASSFGCRVDDAEVDSFLNASLMRECVITFGIVGGKPIVTGFIVKEERGEKK